MNFFSNFSVIFILVSIALHNAVCNTTKGSNRNPSKSTEYGPSNSRVSAKPEMKESNLSSSKSTESGPSNSRVSAKSEMKESNSNSSKSTESGPSDSGVSAKPEMKEKEKITTTENYIIRSRTTESMANSVETKDTTLPAAVTDSSVTATSEKTQEEGKSSSDDDCDKLKDDKAIAKIVNDIDAVSWYMENCYPFRVGDLLPLI